MTQPTRAPRLLVVPELSYNEDGVAEVELTLRSTKLPAPSYAINLDGEPLEPEQAEKTP